ncbi:MAG: YihY family inner membrane protein [Sedimentisphaerales bacterium]|nr:YihY family inner membrane protein [Sedimentisphaerales bacterium]
MLQEILTTPTAQLGKTSRFIVFQVKLWSHCARLLIKNRSGQRAAALAYHTIFGIIPLAIVMLLAFQMFPTYKETGQNTKGLIYEQLHLSRIEYPDPENSSQTIMLTDYLDQIVAKFFSGLDKGSITIISAVIVIWAALALLSTVERAFNNIWHVGRGRGFLHRVINYWALLTLGPLLLMLGIFVSTKFLTVVQLHRTVLTHIGPGILSYIVSVVAFFLLYFVLPNTKVQAKAAIWGAAVAALVWTLAKGGFGLYVTKFIPYSTIYGVLGLIPLGVFWIYITWLIVLFGLQLTFTTQHLKTLDAAEIAAARKTQEHFVANDITAINIMRQIALAFEENNAPVAAEIISSKLNMPAEFTDKILDHLVRCELLAKTSEPKVGFIPVKDPQNISLSDVTYALAQAGFAQSTPDQPQILTNIAGAQQETLAQYNLKKILKDSPAP